MSLLSIPEAEVCSSRFSRSSLNWLVPLLLMALPVCAFAQVQVVLEQDVLTASDTAWVNVRIDFETADSTVRAISAYQFEVRTTPGLIFLRADEMFTLTDRDGWTSGYNAENGRVGAFSSSLDAFMEKGILVRLQFLLEETDTPYDMELNNFRLNSGDPDHRPAVPRLRLDLTSHEE